MNERRSNEERDALLAAELGPLEPEQAADVSLLADVLGDPATWSEPDFGLEDAVVHAVADAEPAAPTAADTRRRHRRFGLAAGAVAAAIAIVVGALAITGGSSPELKGNLAATALAPGAGGRVDVGHNRAGFRIELYAHGLAALPAGQYYQAWLKNAAGTLVPIGTFSSSDGRITLWSGVSPKDFPTLTVTIEAADNNQASSGRRVLTGEVHGS